VRLQDKQIRLGPGTHQWGECHSECWQPAAVSWAEAGPDRGCRLITYDVQLCSAIAGY
jgi:hypothetical protein